LFNQANIKQFFSVCINVFVVSVQLRGKFADAERPFYSAKLDALFSDIVLPVLSDKPLFF